MCWIPGCGYSTCDVHAGSGSLPVEKRGGMRPPKRERGSAACSRAAGGPGKSFTRVSPQSRALLWAPREPLARGRAVRRWWRSGSGGRRGLPAAQAGIGESSGSCSGDTKKEVRTGCPAAPPPPAGPDDGSRGRTASVHEWLVVRASRLLDGTGAPALDAPTVVVHRGLIQGVYAGPIPTGAWPTDAPVVDLAGHTLLAGLRPDAGHASRAPACAASGLCHLTAVTPVPMSADGDGWPLLVLRRRSRRPRRHAARGP